MIPWASSNTPTFGKQSHRTFRSTVTISSLLTFRSTSKSLRKKIEPGNDGKGI